MPLPVRIICVLSLWVAFGVCLAQAEEPLFDLRKYDEIMTKDRRELKGEILGEEEGMIRFRVLPSRTIVSVKQSDVEKIKRKATLDTEFDRLATQHANDPHKLVEICTQALKYQGLEAKVLKTLEDKSASGHAALLELLGERQLAAQEPGKAEATAQKLLAKQPSGAGYLLLGKAKLALGQSDAALEAVKKAHEQDSESAEIMIALADAYLARGKPQEAQQVFTDVLAKSPRLASAHIGQGRVRLRQGQIAEAEISFTQALTLESDNFQAKLGAAACKVLRKEFDEAYALAEDVLRYENRSAQAYGLQGYALLLKGDVTLLPRALEKIEQSLVENPSDPRVKLLQSVALDRAAYADEVAGKAAEAGPKRDRAVKLLGDVAALDPPDDWIQYLLAEMYWRQGDLDRALRGFKRAAELAPKYAPAHQAVGAVALKMHKWQEADAAYQKASELDPASAEFQAGRGLALLGMNRLAEALAVLKKARELDATNVSALCGLGYIMNAERNEQAARTLFQQALAADGNCSYAAIALKSIFTQRRQSLEYLSFDTPAPDTWQPQGGTKVRAEVKDGMLRWQGLQGQGDSRKLEYRAMLKGDDFLRLEADLFALPNATAELGLRLAARSGTAVTFELEFGKDLQGNLAYRYRDFSGLGSQWKAVEPWPASGKVRLGMAAEDLASGRVSLFVNGIEKGALQLQLRKLDRITAGVFAEVAAKQSVDAGADNLALLMRQNEQAGQGPAPGELIPPDKDKP